jgi:choline dehydrogenase-like flavoprotein
VSVPDVTGEVRVFAEYDRDFTEEADVVVVGSGPCGSVVTRELQRLGKRVVLLEEGPPFTPADFRLDGATSMTRTMREGGLRTTRGYVMPTMQAICLGGGSLVNSAICPRAPDFVLDDWCSEFELERTARKDLDPHYDAVAEFLGIAPTPDDVQGRRNLLFRDACDALGYSSEPISRNVRGCRGSGECFTGCRSRAKQSMDLSYIPDAIARGARVLTSVQVQGIVAEGHRASAVEGRVVAPFTGRPGPRFRVRAKAIVLSAGCMATPVLLQKSGNLANRSGQVGENLQLETLWAPPGVMAVRMPGFGHDLKTHLAEIPYAAVWDAITSCHRSLGRVRARRGSMDPTLRWSFHPEDARVVGRTLQVLTELFFAAGARKVLPGVYGIPDELHSLDEAEILRRREIRPTDLVVASNHAFCTTRMHGDPGRGVVDELGRCHDLENLYIADTGVFPRCTGVNPMFTGMALAHRTAAAIAERV